MTRILVASGIRLYGEGLAEILSRDQRLEVVGVAADADQALEAVARERPNIVLLDLELCDVQTIIAAIHQRQPDCRVIALGVDTTEADVIAWAEAGVAGYVFRNDSVDELVTTVESVCQEELRCSRRLAAALLRRVATLSALSTASCGSKTWTCRSCRRHLPRGSLRSTTSSWGQGPDPTRGRSPSRCPDGDGDTLTANLRAARPDR